VRTPSKKDKRSSWTAHKGSGFDLQRMEERRTEAESRRRTCGSCKAARLAWPCLAFAPLAPAKGQEGEGRAGRRSTKGREAFIQEEGN